MIEMGVPFMFSERIKRLRKQKGATQSDIANLVGVTYQAVGKWERGIATPDYEALVKLAGYFGVSTDYLLGRDAAPVGTGSQTPSAAPKSGAKEADEHLSQKKEYIELHRLVDQLSHSDVEELLNTARFKKNKAERIREHVDDPDDF